MRWHAVWLIVLVQRLHDIGLGGVFILEYAADTMYYSAFGFLPQHT